MVKAFEPSKDARDATPDAGSADAAAKGAYGKLYKEAYNLDPVPRTQDARQQGRGGSSAQSEGKEALETSRGASAAAAGKDRQTGKDVQQGRETQESSSKSSADRPVHRGLRFESDSRREHDKIEKSHDRHSRREKFLANRLIRFQNGGASVAADEAQKEQGNNKSDRVNGSDNTRRANGSDNLSGQVDKNPDDNRYFPGIDLVIAAVLAGTAIAKSKHTESAAASQLDQAPKPVPQPESIQNKFDSREGQAAQEKESKEKESKEDKRREQSKRDHTSEVDSTNDAAQMPSDMPGGNRRAADPDAARLAAQSEIAAQLASKIADSADELLPGLAFEDVDSDNEPAGINEDDRSQKISKFFTKMASQTVREVHQVGKGDTLNSLAEQRFNNRNLAALFVRVNRGRIKEYTVDNQKVVELSIGQTIEIPTEAEAERYLRSDLGRADGSIMTIITEPVNSRTVNNALSKLV